MEINGMKVTQGRIDNLDLNKFLNPSFSNILNKEMNNVKIIHLGIAVKLDDEDETESVVSLAYLRKEDANNKTLTIKVSKEEHMDQIIDVIKSFNKEG